MKDTSPARKRNITLRYDISSSLAAAGIPSSPAKPKKLRRLPHVFCRVLELPFSSDVPVAVEENRECFRLPSSTLPELSSAVYSDGELVVTVPKNVSSTFPAEEDDGTLIEARDEDLGAENGHPRSITRTDCNSENPNEEGPDTGKFEGQVFYNSETGLNNGRGGLASMRPGIPIGSLVAVQ